MNKTAAERTDMPGLPATSAGKGLGSFPLRSAQSRAAARALVIAREEKDDKEPAGLAEQFHAALERRKKAQRQAEERGETWPPPPTYTPPRTKPRPGSMAERLDHARKRRWLQYQKQQARECEQR